MSETTLFAQSPDTVWTKLFGGSDDDRARSVIETSDGRHFMDADPGRAAYG
jgi:hypothetical protein